MRRKKIMGQLVLFLMIVGLIGCGQAQETGSTKETTGSKAETAAVSDQSADDMGGDNDSDSITGQGFKPPNGSHIDKNRNIVTPEGDTFSKDGGWQVPEGGRVDSQGRIYDKNGKMMGGGAKIGSKG